MHEHCWYQVTDERKRKGEKKKKGAENHTLVKLSHRGTGEREKKKGGGGGGKG